ncbi:MAG: DUF2164 domain-containing protein [Firmicutes bacterium HGW-Firmicutes-1]|jgi:uncharacterized protein (DUF2164 family)|nr:MAG: DUF2164 domain-containing protein [Firmicutes bacterium HGW-Firmicutes-1]
MRKAGISTIELTKEQKKQASQEIIEYFAREREESIGDLAGELILDFITNKIGPYFYNQAIVDVQKYMSEKIEDMYGLMH